MGTFLTSYLSSAGSEIPAPSRPLKLLCVITDFVFLCVVSLNYR